MNKDYLLDDPERRIYRRTEALSKVFFSMWFCLIVGTDYFHNPFLKEWDIYFIYGGLLFLCAIEIYMRLNLFKDVARENVVYYEREHWNPQTRLLAVFLVGGVLLVICFPWYYFDRFFTFDRLYSSAMIYLTFAIIVIVMDLRLVEDFCIHHSGIYTDKHFFYWRDVAGFGWKGKRENILVLDMRKDPDPTSESKQYRWKIPPEQKERIDGFLKQNLPTKVSGSC